MILEHNVLFKDVINFLNSKVVTRFLEGTNLQKIHITRDNIPSFFKHNLLTFSILNKKSALLSQNGFYIYSFKITFS